MATLEGIHEHAGSGRRYHFRADYQVDGPTDLRWQVEWWADDSRQRRFAEGVIVDAHVIAFSHRLVVDQIVEAIDAAPD
jgi:hypothetical protein